MLEDFDKRIIADFIEANFGAFQHHLEEREIEGTEAEQILDKLRGEIKG